MIFFSGVSNVICTDGDYGWCATSTDRLWTIKKTILKKKYDKNQLKLFFSAGNYQTWAYCGFGNSNGDSCYFPFTYNGVDYTTCTDTTSGSGWCATSVYLVTGTYNSYKYCDADELALGMTSVDAGSGTTISGETCVAMVYSGVQYEKCTDEEYGKIWLTIWSCLTRILISLVCNKCGQCRTIPDLAILRDWKLQ